jgi:hypothetical protein
VCCAASWSMYGNVRIICNVVARVQIVEICAIDNTPHADMQGWSGRTHKRDCTPVSNAIAQWPRRHLHTPCTAVGHSIFHFGEWQARMHARNDGANEFANSMLQCCSGNSLTFVRKCDVRGARTRHSLVLWNVQPSTQWWHLLSNGQDQRIRAPHLV